MAAPSVLLPAAAARRLGVSVKALRVYERAGLLEPGRTRAGWRAYGPADLERARDVLSLRALGMPIREIREAVLGEPAARAAALARHATRLEDQARGVAAALAGAKALGADDAAEGARAGAVPGPMLAFDLPWPWGGERFETAPRDR